MILKGVGFEIKISCKDYSLLKKYKWYIQKTKGRTSYVRTRVVEDGRVKWFYIHQLIMGTIGTRNLVDHKDGDGLNNTRSNLRISSHSDNIKNRHTGYGTSRYWGVSLRKEYGRPTGTWKASININGKSYHLGLFKSEDEAAIAYNNVVLDTGNPYYKINIIGVTDKRIMPSFFNTKP